MRKNQTIFVLWLLFTATTGLTIWSSDVYAQQIPNQVQVSVLKDKIIGVNAAQGGTVIERLLLGEIVLRSGADGLVGFAWTNRRILGFSARSNAWIIRRFNPGENVRGGVKLGDQVVLTVTNLGAYALSPLFLNWSTAPFMAGEFPMRFEVSNNLGLVVTARRVLGFSSSSGRWSILNLLAGEKINEVAVADLTATVQTDRGLLIFNASTGRFERVR